jgi:LmbE family N-acetylglucosaminyl deacetylase
MKWIYLSPHLDDAIYSCGGLIHQQARQGLDVEIWTIFAGQFDARKLSPFAKDIHQRWGTGLLSVQARRIEDQKACAALGVTSRYYNFQDVIYRQRSDAKPEIVKDRDLFRDFTPDDTLLKESVKSALLNALQEEDEFQVCVPLGLGNHIDHQIVRKAAEALVPEHPYYYYADFPYVVREEAHIPMENSTEFVLSEEDVHAWCKAMAIYETQISTFWEKEKEICEEIIPYWQKGGGSSLWISEQ